MLSPMVLSVLAVTLLACSNVAAEAVPAESCETKQQYSFDDDEFAKCNVGSSCREEYNRANGSANQMWLDEGEAIALRRLQTEGQRVKLNEYQPAVVPKFTEVGYKKEVLNPSTYAYLMTWYKSQLEAQEPQIEKWSPDNTYMNHWEVDTAMINAPVRVHKRLYDDLQPLMEEWSGTKLKSTSCYGVRHYPRGSVLANHVDRVDTHVISGIINVAQHNVDTDWPLYVLGHDGVARDILIQPGEIIFYESASVVHGRPQAFQGDTFANIFVHFVPQEGWDVTRNDIEMAARAGAREKRTQEKKIKNTAMAA